MTRPFTSGLVRGASFAAAGLSALMLVGCNSTSSDSGHTSYGVALFGNPTNQPTAQPTGPQVEYTCPGVSVLEGTAAYRVAKPGSSDVAHQASLNDVARECTYSGSQFSLKVGVEGRMLIGTVGRPGTYSVPIRIAVKRGEKVVTSRISRVSVTIPSGQTSTGFAHVEEGIVLPIGAEDPGDEYEVIVGFDPAGGRAGRR